MLTAPISPHTPCCAHSHISPLTLLVPLPRMLLPSHVTWTTLLTHSSAQLSSPPQLPSWSQVCPDSQDAWCLPPSPHWTKHFACVPVLCQGLRLGDPESKDSVLFILTMTCCPARLWHTAGAQKLSNWSKLHYWGWGCLRCWMGWHINKSN